MRAWGESFSPHGPLICAPPNGERIRVIPTEGAIVSIVIYLIAAAVIVCGCIFFIGRARSRD
jgi:hypothetical protein